MKARGHLRSVGERGRGAAAATPGPEVATLVMEMMGAADTDTEHTGTRIPANTGPYDSILPNGKYLGQNVACTEPELKQTLQHRHSRLSF